MASTSAWKGFAKLATGAVARSRPAATLSTRTLPRHSAQTIGGRRGFSASSSAEVKKYTEDHEWVELDTDGTTGTIGISTYAAKALGEVVFVELPTVDAEVQGNDVIGAVESVKSASDIRTPVSGTILETNGELEGKPGNINKNPESGSWIAKIKVTDPRELDALMDDAAYAKYTTEADSH